MSAQPFDPKAYLGRRVVAGDQPTGPVTLIVLSAARRLHELGEWEPVGSLVEVARESLRGETGMTGVEIQRITRWANRWERLNKQLRAFYVRHTSGDGYRECAHTALLRVLEGNEPTGPLRREIKDLWMEDYGFDPVMDLIPTRTMVK